MEAWNPLANELFLAALEQPAGDARAQFLAQACRGDQALRTQVEALLAGHERADVLLSRPPGEFLGAEFVPPIVEAPGAVIGPYKLLEVIGEGGMGVVFMAEQAEPVRRTVALKIVKPGMDSRDVAARFEAERTALSLMDHPNIARVLDAGTTEAGRPYFAMELVRGVPLTEYCDAQRLTPRQRLELFLPLCRAVHHAHQKGIIHRDLKPSNVMVALYDGRPVPKVIDFGVAKATSMRLTEQTLHTGFGAVIGTLEYMSPEQAELNQLDVDTRSDVYSLGVLLYELLTGSTPFDRQRLRSSALEEMLRVIREEAPPRASIKLSSSAELAAISANRQIDPGRLSHQLRGELDWIIMKALEKDRSRRYETAERFAADVERYLRDEPVEARPPSAVYRMRKFARRHRRGLAWATLAGLAMLIALVSAASAIGWAVRDRAAREDQLRQEQAARRARVDGQVETILEEVERSQRAEDWAQALVAAQRAESALAGGDATPAMESRARRALARLELVQRLDDIRAQSGAVWGTRHEVLAPLAIQADEDYADAFRQAGIDVDALTAEEAARRIAGLSAVAPALLPAIDDWIVVRSSARDAEATARLADVLRLADSDLWRQRLRDCLSRQDWRTLEALANAPDLDRQPAATLAFLCAAVRQHSEQIVAERRRGDRDAEPYFLQFPVEIEVLRRAQRRYPDDFWINHRLGISLVWWGEENAKEGVGYMRAALAVRPDSAHVLMNLGTGLASLKRYDDAIDSYRRAIAIAPTYGACHIVLGIALRRVQQYDASLDALANVAVVQPERGDLIAVASAEATLLLCTCEDVSWRDAARAASLAEEAIRLDPGNRKTWTALGLARLRGGDIAGARAAIDRAQALGVDGLAGLDRWDEAFDWLILALCADAEGEPDEARRLYDQAAEWIDQSPATNEDLDSLRREVQTLLGDAAAEPVQ